MLRYLLHARTIIIPFVGEFFFEQRPPRHFETKVLFELKRDGQAALYAGRWDVYFTPRGWKPQQRRPDIQETNG